MGLGAIDDTVKYLSFNNNSVKSTTSRFKDTESERANEFKTFLLMVERKYFD